MLLTTDSRFPYRMCKKEGVGVIFLYHLCVLLLGADDIGW